MQNLNAEDATEFVAMVDENKRDDIEQAIISAFIGYTATLIPGYKEKPYKVYIENNDKQIIAGLMGVLVVNYDCVVHLASVDVNYQKQGLGTLLFTKLDEYARANNCTNIRLETSAMQAKEFYEKLGFAEIAAYADGFLGYTNYVMRKYLP